MKIQIVVECRFGEESMWVSEISDYEFNILEPLIAEIERRKGYFPTGDYYTSPDPKPEDLYGCYGEAFKILQRSLPTPCHGFGRISEVHIFKGKELELYI